MMLEMVPKVDVFRAERDALAFFGVLAHMSLLWDAPIPVPTDKHPTHHQGLNIHATVIDNTDGEVLALDRNTIHQDVNPLQHAEQHAIRTAMQRLKYKRPYNPATSVESYYRSHLFYAEGDDDTYDGCTLYTSLEPCPMCTSTLLVSRMKRTVFIIPDPAYGSCWGMLYPYYQKKSTLSYGALQIPPLEIALLTQANALFKVIIEKSEAMKARDVYATHYFDEMREELTSAYEALRAFRADDLQSPEPERSRNIRTLQDMQRLCGMTGE